MAGEPEEPNAKDGGTEPAPPIAGPTTARPVAFNPAHQPVVDQVLLSKQRHTTIRIGIISGAVVTGIGFVSWALVEIKKTQSIWDVVIAGVLTFLSLYWPVSRCRAIYEKFRGYMKKDHQRVLELESAVDKTRSSSGLNKDGTSPHGT